MRAGTGIAARFAGAGALVLFLCWQHVEAVRLGYRVEAARRSVADRSARVAALRVELDERLSPAEVAAAASRMGLVPASPSDLRRLPDAAARPESALARLWTRRLAPLVAAARS
ncbi:MAG: hypothetical protein KGM24_14580 [Elusimicrobia bacterium]|nr:hypothetical protein [Elusimicrobiota bacterium]